MIDQPQASRLAKAAFDFWQSGQAESAVPLYQKALQFADPEHYALADYHGEFAGVLSVLGRFTEAREQYQLALSVHRRQDNDEFGSGVVIARYFLAEHYLQQQEPLSALETVEPSLKAGIPSEWLLRLIRAFALHALDRHSEARAEADLALVRAPSDSKRQELSKVFAEKLVA